MKSIIFILLIFGLNCIKTQAQNTISLENAINLANQNNLRLRQFGLETAHSEAMIKTYKDIAKTGINTELGQFNSSMFDTKIGISQTLALPIVYQSQKNILTENFKTKQVNESILKYEISKSITSIFYEYHSLKSKEKLVLKNDSLYFQLLKNATIQVEKGEGNLIEKALFLNQKAKIELELKQIQQEIALKSIELQYLLNSPNQVFPKLEKSDLSLNFNTSIFENHPQLKLLLQAKNEAIAQTNLEKTKLLPEFNLGYNNISIRGIGANEKYYTGINRFHSAQLGVNIPIYKKNIKQQIEVSKLNENIIENEWQLTNKTIENKYQQLILIYKNKAATVEYYEKEGLKTAEFIIESANKQLIAGEINYAEFINYVNQAIEIEFNYLEAQKELNKIILDINYL